MPKKISNNKSDNKVTKVSSMKKEKTVVKSTLSNKSNELNDSEANDARKEILSIITKDTKTDSVKPPKRSGTTTETKTGTEITVRRQVAIAALAVVVVVVLALGVFGVGLYRYNWNDSEFGQRVVKFLPYPAAIVGTSFVTYKSFNEDYKALEHYYTKQYELNPEAVVMPSSQDMKDVIMDKNISDAVLKKEAKKAGVAVSDQELNDEVAKVIEDSGGQDLLEQSLEELYGWDVDKFKNSIIKTYLLRQKMQAYIAENDDNEYNSIAKTKIENIYKDLNEDEYTFEELANSYSEDVTAGPGGDLGFMSLDEMDEDLAMAVSSMDENEISGVVKSRYGYHIIKKEEAVMGAEVEEGTDGEGVAQYHISHIFVGTQSIDDYLNNKADDFSVHNFVQ
ncbi:peptidylprolyl isomerase [Patescibacteria group bacterium]|nr:peptidylprolyl isomerase [Patescibacteria group bacterium]MBU1889911.1 peptidylprolyl isomerase [Patescibacteria group bacterium]